MQYIVTLFLRYYAIRFYPKDCLKEFITTEMGEVAKRNPGLSATLMLKDYNEKQSNQRVLDYNRLKDLIEVISRHRLGLKNTNRHLVKMNVETLSS